MRRRAHGLAGALAALAGVLFGGSGLAAAHSGAAEAAQPKQLTLATWNLEWLIAPEDFKPLKSRCLPRNAPYDPKRLPCDVANRFERSSRDFAALARYARILDADVIALQEVNGAEAARLVFPGYRFCFSKRKHVQNNGFAIRPGLPYRCGEDVKALSLRDSVRRGTEVILFPGDAREMRLLSVHLKSGCSRKSLSARDKACRELARQLPLLESWIDAQARAGRRFAVLGDFNRDLLGERRAPGERGFWGELDDGDPPEADLVNAAEGQPFRNCVPGQSYTSYIDYIVLSRGLGAAIVPGSFRRVTYGPADARRTRLSDHCPVAIQVRVGPHRAPK